MGTSLRKLSPNQYCSCHLTSALSSLLLAAVLNATRSLLLHLALYSLRPVHVNSRMQQTT
jgi:hypothetical protein